MLDHAVSEDPKRSEAEIVAEIATLSEKGIAIVYGLFTGGNLVYTGNGREYTCNQEDHGGPIFIFAV